MCCHDEPELAGRKKHRIELDLESEKKSIKVCVAHVTFVLARVLFPHCHQISKRTCNEQFIEVLEDPK